jgi:hypothetical protein
MIQDPALVAHIHRHSVVRIGATLVMQAAIHREKILQLNANSN